MKAIASGGVAASETTAATFEALLELSDGALYQAKAEGRNRIERAGKDTGTDGGPNVFRVA